MNPRTATSHILSALLWAALVLGLLNAFGCGAEQFDPDAVENHVPWCGEFPELGAELTPSPCPGGRDIGMCEYYNHKDDKPEWVPVRCWFMPQSDRFFTCVPACIPGTY